MTEFPTWLNMLCALSVATGILCALVILFAIFRHPNHMVIMRIVWPVCALFGTVFVLWLFFSLWPGGGPSFRRIAGKRCSLQNAGGICAVRNHGGEGHTALRRWLRNRRHHCGVVGIRDASGRHRFLAGILCLRRKPTQSGYWISLSPLASESSFSILLSSLCENFPQARGLLLRSRPTLYRWRRGKSVCIA